MTWTTACQQGPLAAAGGGLNRCGRAAAGGRPRGFTLIELMVLIAVLAVALQGLFAPIPQLLGWLKADRQEYLAQEAVTTGFTVLHQAFRQARQVRLVSTDEVVCLGEVETRLRRGPGGKTLELVRPGGVLRLDFLGAAVFGPFQQVDDRTVWGPVFLDRAKIPMFWRCGP